MSESKWFWAWLRLKKREEKVETPTEYTDQAMLSALISALRSRDTIRGDGKFSRVDFYIRGIRTELEWCRANWVGSDDVLTAFYMGVDAMCTEFEFTIDKIKKG